LEKNFPTRRKYFRQDSDRQQQISDEKKITGAQHFNYAAKFYQNAVISALNVAFWTKLFLKKFFNNCPTV